MNSYNYSYNVLINRLEAFAAGHLLIKRFTHGQIDLADMDQDEQYPFMHVVPNNIKPVDGGMQFDFQIIFADIPRDKEVKAEYQREVISDCVRLAQDLIAEVKNGLALFGFDVQLVTPPVIEPFMEEYKNTLTGVTFSLQLEVPWDWSACDIPAVWAVGGSSTGGQGSPIGITLRTNGVDNAVQSILDLVAGTNVTITDNGDGSITFDASGGGPQVYVSTEFNANHATALGNQYVIGDRVWYNGSVYACIANNDGINPTNPSYWTLQAVGYRLRQTPIDWNASSGDYQILNKPTLATVATSGDYNDLTNLPTIPPAQVNSDWNASSGVAQILNKPTIPAAQIQSDWTQANTSALDYIKNKPSIPSGTVTSVALTVPSAFTVSGSPITNAGTLAITGNGTALQYVDGTGALQAFPAVPKTLEDLIGFGIKPGDLISWSGSQWQIISLLTLDGLADVNASAPNNGEVLTWDAINGEWISQALPTSGTVTSVGLSMPAPANPAFTVSGSPVTTSGTLAVSANGTSSQYVDGTGALQSFPALTGFVPYTGATQDVDLGTNKLSSASVYITGTNGNGHVHLKHQNADATATGQSTAVWADNNGDIKWKNDGQYKTTLKSSSNTADRVYTLPDETCTLMPRNAAITGATKTKITYDSDGLVTAGADLAASDIPSGIDATKIGAGIVNDTEFGYLDGVTSSIQTQLNGKQATIGLTTVGTNLATLPNPSAVRYLRINADNTVTALTLAQIKSDLSISSAIMTANVSNVGTGFESLTELSFAVTANKTYKWRATMAFTATAAATFSLTGPASPTFNVYRFTASNAATTNAVFNGTAYDTGTNAAVSSNGMCTADGLIKVISSGTVTVRIRCATAAALTVRAGSIIEFEEVL